MGFQELSPHRITNYVNRNEHELLLQPDNFSLAGMSGKAQLATILKAFTFDYLDSQPAWEYPDLSEIEVRGISPEISA